MKRDDAGEAPAAVGHCSPVATSQIFQLITEALQNEASKRLDRAEELLSKGNPASVQDATVSKLLTSLAKVASELSCQVKLGKQMHPTSQRKPDPKREVGMTGEFGTDRGNRTCNYWQSEPQSVTDHTRKSDSVSGD